MNLGNIDLFLYCWILVQEVDLSRFVFEEVCMFFKVIGESLVIEL